MIIDAAIASGKNAMTLLADITCTSVLQGPLPERAERSRAFLVEKISCSGGQLGPNSHASTALSYADGSIGVGDPATGCARSAGQPKWTSVLCAAAVLVEPDVAVDVAGSGLGGRTGQALAAAGAGASGVTFALPPQLLPAARDAILRAPGLDPRGIAPTVLKRLGTSS